MKAILVIDMPKVCGECKASFCGDVWYCYAGEYRRPLFTENIQEKPSWCPLRPLPNKQATNLAIGIDLVDGFKDGWNYGWNACIDEIIGDNNE